jgi:glycosyltransferase involved in cell wall biosynthesis
MKPTLTDPGITVVIPVYKGEKYLPRALQSLAIQEYKNFEVDIHIDLPQSGTEEAIKEQIDMYNSIIEPFNQLIQIRVFFHPGKTSPAAARNRAINCARSVLISFLDSDDEFLSNRLGRSVKAFSQSDIDVYYARTNVIKNGELLNVQYGEDFKTFDIFTCNYIPHPTITVRKSVCKEFDERLRGMDDWMWNMNMAESGARFFFDPVVVLNYYIHHNNLTSDASWIESFRQQSAIYYYRRDWTNLSKTIYRLVFRRIPIVIRTEILLMPKKIKNLFKNPGNCKEKGI